MTNSYKKEIDELIAKEKVQREIINETPECKIVKLHSSIDGKKCNVCDKERNPNKIFGHKHNKKVEKNEHKHQYKSLM